MNLTVEEMDVLNFRLTEVSLELLGNSFFDIFGRKCGTLGSLHRSKTGLTTNEFAANSDLVAAIKVRDIFNEDDQPTAEETHGGTLRKSRCKSEVNSETSSNEDSDECDEAGYSNYDCNEERTTEMKITEILNNVEEGNIGHAAQSWIKIKYFFIVIF